jgi:Family of unknown function (DUF5947)
MLDEQRGELLCACRACTLLFQRDAAGRAHYRLIPERRTRLPAFSPHELGVPVGLVFFVPDGGGSATAHYPSPMGATSWHVEPEQWQALRQRCPPIRDLTPGVQALLVNTARGAREHWIVPLDDCYRLVALIRQAWTGLSGGAHVWPAIERFFTELDHHPSTAP